MINVVQYLTQNQTPKRDYDLHSGWASEYPAPALGFLKLRLAGTGFCLGEGMSQYSAAPKQG